MATFTVNIDLDNDAFQPSAGPEVARILRRLTDSVEKYGPGYRKMTDIYGNTVGVARVQEGN